MRTEKSSKKTLTDQASDLVEQATPYVEAARERIVNDYLPVAQSMLADARDVAVEVAQDARDAAQDAAARAEKSTRKSRKKAAKRARAKARELVDQAAAAAPDNMPLVDKVQEKMGRKPRRKRRFLLLLAIAGAGALVARRLKGDQPSHASYTPPRPASAPTGSATTSSMPVATADPQLEADPATAEGGADAGGAFLDEVVADTSDEPRPVTTPDAPAEVEDVAEVRGSKKG